MKFARSIRSLLVVLLLSGTATVFLPGCHPDTSTTSATTTPTLPTVAVKIGDQTFTLEIANTDAERQLGLMHRQFMPTDHGMIFVFPAEAMRGFWMRNTHIPLDILYLDKNGKIISIRKLEPLNEKTVSSIFPAQYAIELNQGMAEKVGIHVGQSIEIPAEAKHTDE